MPEKTAGRPLVVIFRIVLVIILIPVMLLAALSIHFLFTMHSPGDFLPSEYVVYLQIPSIRDLYDNLIDLEAADVIFSSRELAPIQKAMAEFKSQSISRSVFFRQLLNVRADAMALKEYRPLIVFDLGWRSILTRIIPLVGPFTTIDKLAFIRESGVSLFRYGEGDQAVYLSFHDNLVLASTDTSVLLSAIHLKEKEKHLNGRDNLNKSILSQAPGKGDIRIITDTTMLLSDISTDSDIRIVLGKFAFPEPTVVTLNLSNDRCVLNASTAITSEKDIYNSIIRYRPAPIGGLRYLPEQTTMFSSVNVGDFRSLYTMFLETQGEKLEKDIAVVDKASRMLIGMGLDDLLFSWPGSETGMFFVSRSTEPVLYLRIRDEAAFNAAIEKINASMLADIDRSLVLDEVRVNRIVLPWFLKQVVNLFIKGVDTPYYIVKNDFFFLSMDPENLSLVSRNADAKKLLVGTKSYKDLSGGISTDSNIFLYYDLNYSVPFFLKNENLVTRILSLYGRGTASVRNREGRINLGISAERTQAGGTVPYPGFPRNLEASLSGDLVLAPFGSRSGISIVYADRDGNLQIAGLAGDDGVSVRAEKNTAVVPGSGREVFAWAPSGTVYRMNRKGEFTEPFPVITDLEASFPPFVHNEKLVFYSGSTKSLSFLDSRGERSGWTFEIPKKLFARPSFRDGLCVFYPKSFTGEVYLTDEAGNPGAGWPVFADGISFCSPGFVKSGGVASVAFLTQKGTLHVWNLDGQQSVGFPIALNGVYYADPVYPRLSGREEGILTMSEGGLLSLFNLRGELVQERTITGLSGKEARMMVSDIDKDGIDEIFIYGDKNYIIGLDKDLRMLQGFPVKGSQRPGFIDINQDGVVELVAGSFDNHVYAYTVRK